MFNYFKKSISKSLIVIVMIGFACSTVACEDAVAPRGKINYQIEDPKSPPPPPTK